MDCKTLHNLPLPHKVVPIVVAVGKGKTLQTYGYWTAHPREDKLTNESIVWYSASGTACGWVIAWYALPRVGFFDAIPQHMLQL